MSHNRRKAHPLSSGKGQGDSWVDVPDEFHKEGEESFHESSSSEEEEEDTGPGWTESITSLREGDGATELLNGDEAAQKASAMSDCDTASLDRELLQCFIPPA